MREWKEMHGGRKGGRMEGRKGAEGGMEDIEQNEIGREAVRQEGKKGKAGKQKEERETE